MADDKDLVFPRLMYRGDADTLGTGKDAKGNQLDSETKRVEDRDGYDQAKKEGWRGERDDKGHAPKDDHRGTIAVPAQRIATQESARVANEAGQTGDAAEKAAKPSKNAGALPAPARNQHGVDAKDKK